ncbi:MAG: response regulator [SAR324 cluster bacterium]|nr:response regulator [SAR324 cluster bacterium]
MEMVSHPKILIVDDNPQNIKVLGSILREHEYQVIVASSGKETLMVTPKVIPDLILLDIMMPEMGGFEVCRHLKESEECKDIPIIFLTAKTRIESMVEGFELGAVDYITKPFETAELLVRINTHLKIAYLRMELQKSNEKLEQRVIEKTATILGIEKTLESEVDEAVLRSLENDVKSWFVDALKGMLVIDGRMDDNEIAYLRTILTFLGNKEEAERLLEMIKLKKEPRLETKAIEVETVFFMLTILMKLAIVDDKLSQSEADYMNQMGQLLGVDNSLIRRMLNWGNNRLKANIEHKQLRNMFISTVKSFQQGPQSTREARMSGRPLHAGKTRKE